ncbi:MAG TPA: hypothetical protein DCZ93_08945 [Elusimicrobia bacterium]|nr:hypothetical protein [Elusimicrobiota bacterium]
MRSIRGSKRKVLPGKRPAFIPRPIIIFALFSVLTAPVPNPCFLTPLLHAQAEFTAVNDLAALGADGTAPDPDVEIKGFTVFGATQAAYTGAEAGPGNVMVNGALTVSSGAYFVGNSTFPAAGSIFVNDGSAGQTLRKNSAGHLEWSAAADNLGDHTATTAVNMAGFPIMNISSAQISGTGVSGAAALFQVAGSTMMVLNNGNVGIGTAAPGAKLEVAGQIKITGGSPAEGTVLTSDADGLAAWETPPAPAGMPSGLSMYFNLATCPAGWTELTLLRGRYLVGVPSGGTISGAVGTQLTNLENRAVGQHTHTYSETSHSHTQQKPVLSAVDSQSAAQVIRRYTFSGNITAQTSGITINSAGTVAGTNAPYMQLLLCQKD